MALWRIRGEVNFQTVARRTAFVADYNAWKIGRSALLLESHQVLNTGDEDGQVTQPTTRSDIVFTFDGDNDALYDWIRNRSVVGIDHVFLSAHRCRFMSGGSDTVRYFEWRR